MHWADIQPEFAEDGALWDICVLNATIEDWEKVHRALRGWGYPIEYTVDGVPTALPATASVALSDPFHHMLALDVAGIRVVTHFFTEDEIDFDVAPRDVNGQKTLDALLEFLRRLGRTVGRPVLVTPENLRTAPFLEYSPHTDVFTHLS